MTSHIKRTAAAIALLLAAPAWAQKVDYAFAGIYNTSVAGSAVSLGYTGSFTIADPVQTLVKPANAADVTSPSIAAVWQGSSLFYTGASDLKITFSNGATLLAPNLSLVVNNTTFQGLGSPYPMGLSVQMFTEGATASGMTASLVCPNGTTDTVCDDSGVDPLYRKGDASDLAVQRMTGVYFAFWGAPLSSAEAGVPNLANTFSLNNGGLGVYSVDDQGHPVTTLTNFSQLSSVTTASTVPEPGSFALLFAGLMAMRRGVRRGLSSQS